MTEKTEEPKAPTEEELAEEYRQSVLRYHKENSDRADALNRENAPKKEAKRG